MTIDAIDYGPDKIATHSFTEGEVEKHVERVTSGAGVLGDWDDTATIAATGLVADFTVPTTGKGRIIIGCLCEGTLATTLLFRLQFKNAAGAVVGLSAEASSALTEVTDGGSPAKRYGTLTVFANDVCASSVQMYVTTLPVGATAVTVMMAAV
jgi:hypothetical protein